MAKSFEVCRKNFLFSNTQRGATASAVTLSVIATAMENGLDPYKYLTYVFRKAQNIDLNNEKHFPRSCLGTLLKTHGLQSIKAANRFLSSRRTVRLDTYV